MAPPLEDEEPGAEGEDGKGQEVHQRGATGGVQKEDITESVERKPAATQRQERAPLGDRVRVQTRSRKATVEAAREYDEEAPIGTFPLRDYPGAGGVQAIYRPWGSELRAIANEMPKVREDPQKFQRELRVIVECHQPTYVDMNILLKLVVLEGLLRQLKQVAGWPS